VLRPVLRPVPRAVSRTTAATAALAASAALVLTGCSAVQSFVGGVEPERDAETGAIVEAAEANAFALRVGDCMMSTDDLASEELTDVVSVPTVPCDQPHDSEVFAAHTITDETYPGDDAVVTAADDFCYGEFEGFVGMAYEDSALLYSTMFPSSDSWKLNDDREILCVLVDEDGGVTGSLAGAAR
jgi:hypothetical protein